MQETFAHSFKSTFMFALDRYREEIKEYEALRKKLETRKYVLLGI